MRLIDADALMATLGITSMDCDKCAWHDREWSKCKRGGDFEDACCAIENAPTIEDLSGFCDKLWRGAYERGKEEAVEEADRLIDRAALFNRLANAKTMEEVFEIIHGMPSGLVTA